MKIIANTFQATAAPISEVGEFYAERINGTVDVEMRDKTITAYASKYEDGSIYVYGFVGRYRTGTKLWDCKVWTSDDKTCVWFGFDSRSMNRRRHKSDIFFAPEKFFNIGVAA